MSVQNQIRTWAATWSAVVVFSGGAGDLVAGEPVGREGLQEPIYHVSKLTTDQQPLEPVDQHPLDPVLRLASEIHTNVVTNVQDYTCTLIKRENVGGTLMPYEYMACKVRNERMVDGQLVPFSVYLKFLKPDSMKGREVIYVRGHNDNQLVAHEGGFKGRLIPSLSLAPTSMMAMRGNRYPITEIGLETLCRRLIEKGQRDRQLGGECNVRILENASVTDRPCRAVEVTHHQPLPQLEFHKAMVFVDKELQVPIRYEAYDWPTVKGSELELIEEYTYKNLKMNVGLTDADFDKDNPKYNF